MTRIRKRPGHEDVLIEIERCMKRDNIAKAYETDQAIANLSQLVRNRQDDRQTHDP
jgi:hypothetical protein